MRGAQSIQVTQVWYKSASQLDFDQIITDLAGAVSAKHAQSPTIIRDRSNVAKLATKDALIVVGYQKNLTGSFEAGLTIAIGPSPELGATDLDPTNQIAFSQTVFDTLQRRCSADRHQFYECQSDFEVGFIDQLLADAAGQVACNPLSADIASDAHGLEMPHFEPVDRLETSRIMQRLSSDLTPGMSGIISRAIASATVQMQPRMAALATVAGDHKTGKTKHNYLFRKSSEQLEIGKVPALNEPTSTATRSDSELQALRRALYGLDPTRISTMGQIGAKTKVALQQISALRDAFLTRAGERGAIKPTRPTDDGANI